MSETLQCPKNTSEWGKLLITDLGDRLDKLHEKIDGIKTDINNNTNLRIEEIATNINAIKTTAESALTLAQENKSNIEQLRKEFNSELSYLKFTCDKLTSENIKLQDNTDKLENYGRRDNIVFLGVPEEKDETKIQVEGKTRHFLEQHLNLEKNVVENIKFVRVHRLGAPKKDKSGNIIRAQKRPIIARFHKFSDRSMVWNARKHIGDPNVHISENFSYNTEYRRKKLYAIYRKAKNDIKYRSKISLIGDVLIIDSVRYTVDNLSDLPGDLSPRQFGEISNDNSVCFGGIHSDASPFSNWYRCKVPYKEYVFNSTEQAYQYAKAVYCDDSPMAMKIRFTSDPKSAKELGSRVKGLRNTDWEQVKSGIMYDLIRSKFTATPELKTELLKTGKKQLAECGTDKYYSTAVTINSKDVFDRSKWIGSNKLGEILNKVRSDIR